MGSSQFQFFIVSLFCFFSFIVSQQPYTGSTTADCPVAHNSTGNLGYFCNTPNRSCQSFLTFRSRSPFNSVSSISTLLGSDPLELSRVNSVNASATFPPEKLVLVPISCSCSGQFLQSNLSFTTRTGDTYFAIANETLQGLSTCQTLISQNSNISVTSIKGGERILVPLRCACLTKNQTDMGFNYLLSYLVVFGDTVLHIVQRFKPFGADNGATLEANELQLGSTIYPFTTLLIPLKTEPSSTGMIEPTSSPPPSLPASPPSATKRTWVYVVVAIVGGVILLAVIGAVVFFVCARKRKKKTEHTTTEIDSFESTGKPSEKKLDGESSSITLESISSAVQSVKAYTFKELQDATDNFSSTHLIKGSVYHGTINGDSAAIKKMNGDVSKQINLLNKTNHSNLIRLSGVCFEEGHWYLVFEYAAKGPLSDWIDSNGSSNGRILTWTQRIQIAVDVATGLNYLHSFTNPPHVHKDLKMDNILLDGDFRGKISNFSLARSAGWEEGEFTLTRHIVGTRGYMAPEYLENGLVSTKLDVYSFGILLIELLTGKEVSELHRKENLQLPELLEKVLDEKDGKEYLSHLMDPSLEGNFPIELAVLMMIIVNRCLNKDPSQRPSMDEIVQSLCRILSSSLSWELSNTSV
ncbi:lysM domain receptor-like kinase 4 [Benincasa hispida]|uniref:lysM domain receptor-like kinase 4 n=1 Tax=Benincasa hispida TaxID=102211 RepID=UPI0018FFA729|nr:lysM domain receptor-like kinase 4 [Benincasa hispida]